MSRNVLRIQLVSSFLAAAIVASMCTAQESKLSHLLELSPAPANAAVYIHAPALRKLIDAAKMSSSLSAEIEELWLISDLDTVGQRPNWEAGYAITTRAQNIESLATAVGGYVDTIENHRVVWSPKQAYLLPVNDRQIGIMRPANRKLAGQWLAAKKNSPTSEYLRRNSQQPEKYLSLMVAIDLHNAFSPVQLARQIKKLEALSGLDTDVLATVLASVQGVSIIVGRESLSECILSFEFSQPPDALSAVAPKLVDELLRRNGTEAPEILNWKASVSGNKLSLRGAISEDTLEGLLNIFSLKSQSEQIAQATTSSPTGSVPSGSTIAASSKAFFDRTTALVEKVRKYSAANTGYRAKWNDQMARQIDELPTLNVDTQLVEYGANVSSLLRGNALAIRGVNIQTGAVKADQSLYAGGYYGYSANGYSYGYFDPNTTADYQLVADAHARAAGFGNYQQALSMIDKLTADNRRAMTAKYGVQF